MRSSVSDIPDPSPHPGASSTTRPSSTWRIPLPADEIARQQAILSRLHPGMPVGLRGLGDFIYSGLWDTMHNFYPAWGQDLPALITDPVGRRYLKRDLRGIWYIRLPYTLLADCVELTDEPAG